MLQLPLVPMAPNVGSDKLFTRYLFLAENKKQNNTNNITNQMPKAAKYWQHITAKQEQWQQWGQQKQHVVRITISAQLQIHNIYMCIFWLPFGHFTEFCWLCNLNPIDKDSSNWKLADNVNRNNEKRNITQQNFEMPTAAPPFPLFPHASDRHLPPGVAILQFRFTFNAKLKFELNFMLVAHKQAKRGDKNDSNDFAIISIS